MKHSVRLTKEHVDFAYDLLFTNLNYHSYFKKVIENDLHKTFSYSNLGICDVALKNIKHSGCLIKPPLKHLEPFDYSKHHAVSIFSSKSHLNVRQSLTNTGTNIFKYECSAPINTIENPLKTGYRYPSIVDGGTVHNFTKINILNNYVHTKNALNYLLFNFQENLMMANNSIFIKNFL